MKKFYALFLVLLSVWQVSAQPWDGTSAEVWTQGEGTEQAPYLIEKPSNLAYLSQKVTAGESYEGKFFKLTTNLDMNGKDFPVIGYYYEKADPETGDPIEDMSHYFAGVFDGNHKMIDGLTITKTNTVQITADSTAEAEMGVGLFACLSESGIIRNLVIGPQSNIACSNAVGTGAIVGVLNGGIVENCANLGYVGSIMIAGGIVGAMYENSTVQYCTNKGKVNGAFGDAGGIVGAMDLSAVVQGCYNMGDVEAYTTVGGIAGKTSQEDKVLYCYSAGKLTEAAGGVKLGAIVGEANADTKMEGNFYVEKFTKSIDLNAEPISEEEMRSETTLQKFNNGLGATIFKTVPALNNGFPCFVWETKELTSAGQLTIANDLLLNGRKLKSSQPLTIYDLSGRMITEGQDIQLNEAGNYLIVRPGMKTLKVTVK